MARLSQGSNATPSWAAPGATERPSRVVRLGRPANDNGARPPVLIRAIGLAITTALVVLAMRWVGVL